MTDEGVVTKYRYDELDRLLEAASNLKAISYEYDRTLMPYTRRG
ncbi:YD repeat-containing protein [Pseudobutyrivibrio ruminis]|uniref:YD repeat-containing protein n=2 Tax=Pseudobutyrivibrio ruminis TaxID=46206 RepID=A0A1H7KEY0_9FIRM|nr:YD repeat-containing protein [Pseudobutyrivibrio ruminis]